MAYVTQVKALIERLAAGGRRIPAGPGWPLAGGGLLGVSAMTEVVVRAEHFHPHLPVALVLGLGATVPLAVARSHAVAAAAPIMIATLLTIGVYHRLPGAALVALLVALYLVGRHHTGWVSGLLVLPLVAYALVGLLAGSGPATPGGDTAVEWSGSGVSTPPEPPGQPGTPPDGGRPFPVVLAFLAAAAAGLGTARRAHGEVAERHASRQMVADTLLEHAARGERARIARELHDVVAHHISMIAVQAETARLTTPDLPTDGATRLLAIGDTARAALTEMRRLLGVLREDAGTEPTRQPQPGLRQLIKLIDEVRDSTGASTRLVVRGQVGPRDPGVELTAYRIVQEALTNARRHAPGVAVDVELDYTDDALRLRVRDNGPGPLGGGSAGDLPGEGHGLLGMRERVAAVGGELWIGPAPAGGFLVEARLPAARLVSTSATE